MVAQKIAVVNKYFSCYYGDMETKNVRGRPAGRAYPHAKHFRLMDADARDLETLAQRWRCTEAEAMRRAIRETAKRERLP